VTNSRITRFYFKTSLTFEFTSDRVTTHLEGLREHGDGLREWFLAGRVKWFLAGRVKWFRAGKVKLFLAGRVKLFLAGRVKLFLAGRGKSLVLKVVLKLIPVKSVL